MSITLQFCGFNSVAAKIIERFTDPSGSGIGHVDIVLPDGSLLGAQHENLGGKPSGVQIRPADYGDTCGMINRCRVTLATPEQEGKFYAFLIDQVGKPYDLTAIRNFVTGGDSRNWRDLSAWFCSELACYALEQCGFLEPLWTPADKMPPAMLLTVLSAFAPVVPVLL